MAVPALNVDEIANLTRIASEYKLSFADFVREMLRNYAEQEKAEKAKRELIRQRLANVERADPEEAELLTWIDSMTPEDHEIASVHKIYI